MNGVLRCLGVLLPVLAGIGASFPSNIDTSFEVAEAMALRFTLGLVGRFLIRSWWAVAVAPIVFIVTFWIAREFSCPECSGPIHDVGILGAIYMVSWA